MLRYALCVALAGCCGSAPAVVSPKPTSPCQVTDPGAPPKLHPVAGVLPIEEEKQLIKYIATTQDTRRDLNRCSLVQLVTK